VGINSTSGDVLLLEGGREEGREGGRVREGVRI
jgi:hypothetical protein